jgi:hypothetical protein
MGVVLLCQQAIRTAPAGVAAELASDVLDVIDGLVRVEVIAGAAQMVRRRD